MKNNISPQQPTYFEPPPPPLVSEIKTIQPELQQFEAPQSLLSLGNDIHSSTTSTTDVTVQVNMSWFSISDFISTEQALTVLTGLPSFGHKPRISYSSMALLLKIGSSSMLMCNVIFVVVTFKP